MQATTDSRKVVPSCSEGYWHRQAHRGGEGCTPGETFTYTDMEKIDLVTQLDGGLDTLELGGGITAADVILKLEGADLVLGLGEAGVAFADLADKIRLYDWTNPKNRIETVRFADGTLVRRVASASRSSARPSARRCWDSVGADVALTDVGGNEIYCHGYGIMWGDQSHHVKRAGNDNLDSVMQCAA